jgi:ABC-type maltose transport system permease subunit
MSQDGIFQNKIDLSERFSQKHHMMLFYVMNFVPNFMFTITLYKTFNELNIQDVPKMAY